MSELKLAPSSSRSRTERSQKCKGFIISVEKTWKKSYKASLNHHRRYRVKGRRTSPGSRDVTELGVKAPSARGEMRED